MFHDSSVKKILLVEDNPGDIRMIQGIIQELGFKVAFNVITDGMMVMEALELKEGNVAHNLPDLILLDLIVPKKNGRDLLKEIKLNSYLRHIPVIIITISDAEEDIMRCYNYHANCYIVKTFDIDVFIKNMKAMLTFWLTIATIPKQKEDRSA